MCDDGSKGNGRLPRWMGCCRDCYAHFWSTALHTTRLSEWTHPIWNDSGTWQEHGLGAEYHRTEAKGAMGVGDWIIRDEWQLDLKWYNQLNSVWVCAGATLEQMMRFSTARIGGRARTNGDAVYLWWRWWDDEEKVGTKSLGVEQHFLLESGGSYGSKNGVTQSSE